MFGLIQRFSALLTEPIAKSETRLFMEKLEGGSKCLLLGKEVTVVDNTVEWWDSENLLPSITVGYMNSRGEYVESTFSPREARNVLSLIED